MGKKKTILRVPEGLQLSQELLASLKKTLGEFRLEHYKEMPDLAGSFQQRIDSLHQAALYIARTLALKPGATSDSLKAYFEDCKEKHALPEGLTCKQYQQILGQYTTALLNGIIADCDWSAENEQKALSERASQAIEVLNKADQYVTMLGGRADLATLIPFDIHGEGANEYVLQWDQQLFPCTAETLSELETIQDYGLAAPPAWFNQLPAYQKYFFSSLEPQQNKVGLLKSDFDALVAAWKKINKEALSDKDLQHIAQTAVDDIAFPWFKTLSQSCQQQFKLLCSSRSTLEQFETRLKQVNERLRSLAGIEQDVFAKEFAALKKLPYWYLSMAAYEQRFLKAALDEVEKVEDAVSFIPSRLRTVPGLSNFAKHFLMVFNERGDIVNQWGPKHRSAHLVPRDLIQQDVLEDLHSSRNFQLLSQLAGDNPLFIQTLISPVPLLERLSFLVNPMPDYQLDEKRKEIVDKGRKQEGKIIFSTNHPYNIAGSIYPTQANDPECNYLLKMGQAYLAVMKLPALSKALPEEEFRALLGLVNSDLQGSRVEGAEQSSEADHALRQELQAMLKPIYSDLKQWPDWQNMVCKHLLLMARQHEDPQFDHYIKQLNLLGSALDAYQKLLNSPFGTGSINNPNGRELFLSSLENLILLCLFALIYGSCVSGKDRKALELMHSDAMLLYLEKYGKLPDFFDSPYSEDRVNFAKIFIALYFSRHGHQHAGQNAPGADGIKSPATPPFYTSTSYLPADFLAKMTEQYPSLIADDDILASNNEVKEIMRDFSPTAEGVNAAENLVTAFGLSEEQQKKLLDILGIIAQQKEYWSRKKYNPTCLGLGSSEPGVVLKVRELCRVEDKRRVDKVAGIFYAVKTRTKEEEKWFKTRDEKTEEFYVAIEAFYKSTDLQRDFTSLYDRLETIRQEIDGIPQVAQAAGWVRL